MPKIPSPLPVSFVARAGLMLVLWAAALGLRFVIMPIAAGYAFATFYPTVAIACYLCGPGLGIVLTLFGTAAGLVFFTPPFGSFDFPTELTPAAGLFIGGALIIAALVRELQAQTRESRSSAVRIQGLQQEALDGSHAGTEAALRAEEYDRHLEELVEERTALLASREGALRVSQQRFRNLVEQAPVAMCLVEGDRVVMSNRLFSAFVGWSGSESPSLPELLEHALPDPEARRVALLTLTGAQADTAAVGQRSESSEWVVRAKDGRELRVEVTFTRVVGGVVIAARNVTEHWRRYQQLVELSDFNATLVEKSTHGLIVYRAAGPCVVANSAAARMLGCMVADLLAQNFRANQTWHRYGMLDIADVAFSSGRPQHLERNLVSSFGRRLNVGFDFVPFASGGTKHLLLVMDDVTVFRAAEAALQEASRAKSDFLSNMSHEIRTPMNAILGIAQLLDAPQPPPDQRDLVHKIRMAGQSLLGIINDVLDLSKIEAGRLEIEHAPFELSAVLENVAALMSASVGGKAIELVIEEPPPLDGPLVGDALRLGQVLINLVGNAVKFTAEGSVRLSVRALERDAAGARLRFAVTDTGIGITEDKLEKIFEPFAQAERTTTRRFGGTGLGLSISKRLVEMMGGALQVRSEIGQGSEFWFDLLLPMGEPGAAAPPPAPRRVLIVDDN